MKRRRRNTLLEIFDVLGGKGDPYLVDLFLGFFKAGLGGLHRGVRHVHGHREEGKKKPPACENERRRNGKPRKGF